MRNVPFKQVLDAALELCSVPASEAQTQEVTALLGHINRRLRRAWEYFAWPELVETEGRFFRAAYDNATAYAEDDEVYYAATDAYYRATQATTGNLPTDTDYWEVATDLERYVAWEQAGKTALGEVLEVWDKNPRTSRQARRIGYTITGRGVEFGPSVVTGTQVWVEFRTRPVRMNVTTWDAELTYAAGAEVYFLDEDEVDEHGRCFVCVTSTSAGESPVSAAAKWSEIEFPYVLAEAVPIGAHVDWLKTDGQNMKARFTESDWTEALDIEVEKVVAQQQQQPARSVGVRGAV